MKDANIKGAYKVYKNIPSKSIYLVFQNSSSLLSSTRVNHQSLTFVTEDSPKVSSMDFCGWMTGAIGSWLLLLILEVKAMTAANFAEARESALLKWLAELGGVTSSERKKKSKI